ncbi:metallophosphoesterase, partial [Anaerotruncus massiliensis (ex Liu et al. 2021)]
MIYVTGDVHADLGRFKGKAAKKLKKGDTLIVCGDFGFVWDGSKKEQRVLKWLGKRRYSVLFVEGTHDNLDLLAGYPVVDFCGGKAR